MFARSCCGASDFVLFLLRFVLKASESFNSQICQTLSLIFAESIVVKTCPLNLYHCCGSCDLRVMSERLLSCGVKAFMDRFAVE